MVSIQYIMLVGSGLTLEGGYIPPCSFPYIAPYKIWELPWCWVGGKGYPLTWRFSTWGRYIDPWYASECLIPWYQWLLYIPSLGRFFIKVTGSWTPCRSVGMYIQLQKLSHCCPVVMSFFNMEDYISAAIYFYASLYRSNTFLIIAVLSSSWAWYMWSYSWSGV